MTAAYEWTADLLLVAVATLVATGAVIAGLSGPLRLVLLLPVVLLLPGYALTSALFPDASPEQTQSRRSRLRGLNRTELVDPTGIDYRHIGVAERIVLSMATSLAVVPFVAYVLNFTPLGINTRPIALVLAGVTLVFLVVAGVRRKLRAPKERFTVGSLFPTGRTFSANGSYGALFVGALVVLLATGAFAGYAAQPDDSFSELYLTTTSNGNVTTGGVGDAARSGGPLQVAVENHERTEMTYTVVVQAEQVGSNGQVTESETLQRFQMSAANGETARQSYDGPRSGDRLTFLLYKGSPPENPSRDNAYIKPVSVWMASGSGGSGQSSLASPAGVTN